jgi:hypothetical protein
MKKIITFLLCLVLVMSTMAVAFAIDPRDTSAETSLTVTFAPEETPAEGVEFRLYYVANVDEFCNMTVASPFTNYSIDLKKPTADTYREIEAMLPGVIAADGIAANYTATTDENGTVTFANIPAGLYFVVGDNFEANRKIYTPNGSLVCLPNRLEDDSWQYDVKVSPKFESRPDSEPVEIEILKVWDDNNNDKRPESVTIELYENEELYDTVTLNKENNWQHKWENLYAKSTWSITEKDVPEGYTATYDVQGYRVVITNTKKTTPPPDTPDEPNLPQTGLLWWPVPILVGVGLVLFLIGWSKNMKTKRKNGKA